VARGCAGAIIGLAMLLAGVLPAAAERRVALVVGNAAYKHTTPLANPANDARDMAKALEGTGFEVILALDAAKAEMDGALRAFADKLASADVALFFYAGHGLQVGGRNFLVPVEARLTRERDLEFEAVGLDFVLRQMEIDREGKTTIVMLDACRDNPLSRNLARSMGTRSASVGQGLAPAPAGVGTFIAYSTQPGNVALDGAGRNSPFTAALARHIGTAGRNLNATMIEVRKSVIEATGGRQVPWDHSALTGDFYFVPGEARQGTTAAAPAPKSDDVEALKARLKALEEAERKRAGGAGERAGGVSGNPAFTGETAAAQQERIVKLAEAKARLAVAEDKQKELQARLFEARRAEGQAKDGAERQRLLQASMRVLSDMTRASLEAKKLREEIAVLEAPPSRGTFEVAQGKRAVGELLELPPGTANCESRCLAESRCVAWNLSRDGVCEALAGVSRTVPASAWRTGRRSGTTAGGMPAVEPMKRDDSAGRFESAENVRIEGAALKAAFRVPSPDACRAACDAEQACVAYQHGRKIGVMGQCQLFSSIASRHEDQAWRSGVRTRR
jgi:uncharacterized caspase-like protein